MVKIDKDDFKELMKTAIDSFHIPGGNFWIIHSSTDNKFYGVKHAAGTYWISTGTRHFTDAIFAIMNEERNGWHSCPGNSKFWR